MLFGATSCAKKNNMIKIDYYASYFENILDNYQLLEKDELKYYYREDGIYFDGPDTSGYEYFKEILLFTDEYVIRLECDDGGMTEDDIDIPDVTIDLLLDLLTGNSIDHITLINHNVDLALINGKKRLMLYTTDEKFEDWFLEYEVEEKEQDGNKYYATIQNGVNDKNMPFSAITYLFNTDSYNNKLFLHFITDGKKTESEIDEIDYDFVKGLTEYLEINIISY